MGESVGDGPLFPLPEPNESALAARFRQEFEAVQGEWHEVDSIETARAWIDEWIALNSLSPLLVVNQPRLQWMLSHRTDVDWIVPGSGTKGWESYPVGVTTCESLIAESGTILVSAAISGRAPSVLPPVHLVVATADQLVADLDTSMSRLRARYPGRLPSTMSWITGPSRTADIEKILVLGAHGPKRLAVLILPTGALPPDHV
jgi:L-lactate dehydrogenase complex protein LldG